MLPPAAAATAPPAPPQPVAAASVPAPPPPAVAPTSGPSRRLPILLGLGVLLAVAGVIAFVLTSGDDDPADTATVASDNPFGGDLVPEDDEPAETVEAEEGLAANDDLPFEADEPGAEADEPAAEPDESSTATAPDDDSTEPVADPPGDVRLVTWGVTTPASELDPVQAFDFGTYAIVAQTLEYLTTIGPTGAVVPSLATDWATADARTWTFRLREGVTFHDGRPLQAADVVASLQRAVDVGFGPTDATEISAVDDLTVSIVLADPLLDLPVLLSNQSPQVAITPRDFTGGDVLIGTGPYELAFYAPGANAEFVRNDSWWGGGSGPERIDFLFYDSTSEMRTALEAGAIDGTQTLATFDVERIQADPDIVVRSVPSANHRQMWMRVDTGPFADVRVRQALALSIDREQIVRTIYGGRAVVSNDQAVPVSSEFAAPIPLRPRDIELARALLTEAGFADGLAVTLDVGDLAEIPDLAELIRAQAAEAGFDLTVVVHPNADFYSGPWCPMNASFCDTESSTLGIVDYGHRPLRAFYFDRNLRSTGDWNPSHHAEPAYDALWDAYAGAATEAAAVEALDELQRYVHDNLPIIIPVYFDVVFAHRSDISGVTMSPLGQFDFTQADAG